MSEATTKTLLTCTRNGRIIQYGKPSTWGVYSFTFNSTEPRFYNTKDDLLADLKEAVRFLESEKKAMEKPPTAGMPLMKDGSTYDPYCTCDQCKEYRIYNNLKKGEDPRKKTEDKTRVQYYDDMLKKFKTEQKKEETNMTDNTRILFDYVMYDMGEFTPETESEIEPAVIDRGSIIANTPEHARFILFRKADFTEEQEASFLKGRITIHFHNSVNLRQPGASNRY